MLQKTIKVQSISPFHKFPKSRVSKQRCFALPYYNAPLPIEHVSQKVIKSNEIQKYLPISSKNAPDIKAMSFEDLVENNKVLSVVIHPNDNMLVYELQDGTKNEFHWDGTIKTEVLDKIVEHDVTIKYDNGIDVAKYAKLSFEIAINLIYLLVGVLLLYALFIRGSGE